MKLDVAVEPQTEAPKHVHLEEQIVVVKERSVSTSTARSTLSDVAVVPPWVPHAAWTNDSSCEELDIFSPPRETLVAHARASQRLSAAREIRPDESEPPA